MPSPTTPTTPHLTALPAEILLSIIETVPLERATLLNLHLTHPSIRRLLQNYEISVSRNNAKAYMRHATTDFPPPRDGEEIVDGKGKKVGYERKAGYAWLFRTMQRYDICDAVMSVLTSPFVCHNVRGLNQCAILTGLYLLYRVVDLGDYEAKLQYLDTLALDPLTAILLTIWHATLISRYHGLGAINSVTYTHQHERGHYQLDANQLELRSEIENAFAEAVMEHGPSFIYGILGFDGAAEVTLLLSYHDHAIQDWLPPTHPQDTFRPLITEGPRLPPSSPSSPSSDQGQTLYTALLTRIATLLQCSRADTLHRIVSRSEEDDHSLANLSMEGKRLLLAGLDVV